MGKAESSLKSIGPCIFMAPSSLRVERTPPLNFTRQPPYQTLRSDPIQPPMLPADSSRRALFEFLPQILHEGNILGGKLSFSASKSLFSVWLKIFLTFRCTLLSAFCNNFSSAPPSPTRAVDLWCRRLVGIPHRAPLFLSHQPVGDDCNLASHQVCQPT